MTVTPATRTPRAATLRKQEAILTEAERQFARFGFEGVSLDSIAAALDLSRQNLLYHWPSKEELYRAVLDSVMGEWMASMTAITEADEPEVAIQTYVAVKLRFSRERPSGNAVFTREIMTGALRYQDVLKAQVMPLLHADVARFERWANEGRIRRLEAATALYRGTFLDGFSIRDSESYEEWLRLEREREMQRVLRQDDPMLPIYWQLMLQRMRSQGLQPMGVRGR